MSNNAYVDHRREGLQLESHASINNPSHERRAIHSLGHITKEP